MANIKMKTLTVGEDVFEIVDEQAREAIEELQENGVKTSVESVNGKTGVVTLKASDVGALSASDIVDELTSTESNKALSARLGFQLNSKLTTLRNELNNLEGDGTIEVDMEEGTFSHKDSGVAANWYGEQGGGDLSFGGSFTVPGALNIDAKGHITEARDNQFKLPNNEATETNKGLLSATDKAKLNKLKPPFNFELNNNSASNVDVNVTLFDADEEAVAEFGVVGKGLAKVSRNSTSGALEINVKKETVDLSGYATTQQLATVEGKIPTVAQEKGWDDNSVMSQSAVTFELRNLDDARVDHEEWLIRHGNEIGGLSEEIANLKENGASGEVSWNDLKDKPFGVEMVEIIPETELTFEDMEGLPATILPVLNGLASGMPVKVTWGEDVYECITQADITSEGQFYIGNYGLIMGEGDTGEPFLIISSVENGMTLIRAFDGSTTKTVSVIAENITTIDPKFLSSSNIVDLSSIMPNGIDIDGGVEQFTLDENTLQSLKNVLTRQFVIIRMKVGGSIETLDDQLIVYGLTTLSFMANPTWISATQCSIVAQHASVKIRMEIHSDILYVQLTTEGKTTSLTDAEGVSF